MAIVITGPRAPKKILSTPLTPPNDVSKRITITYLNTIKSLIWTLDAVYRSVIRCRVWVALTGLNQWTNGPMTLLFVILCARVTDGVAFISGGHRPNEDSTMKIRNL